MAHLRPPEPRGVSRVSVSQILGAHPSSPGPPRPPGAQIFVHPLAVQGLTRSLLGWRCPSCMEDDLPGGYRQRGEAQHPPPPPNLELPVSPALL